MTFSLPPATVTLDGPRFVVQYDYSAPAEGDARQVAIEIALEQTVELSWEITSPGDIRDRVVGQLESLTLTDNDRWSARISYPVEAIAGSIPGLINTMFANTSMKQGIKVTDLEIPSAVAGLFPGPQHGVHGVRQLLNAPDRPLIGTALKPLGYSAERLAEIARAFAMGGIDIIKDDHNLHDQRFATFRERTARCADAVNQSNARTGGQSLYAPHVSGPIDSMLERAHLATELGAGALEIMPGIMGYDAIRLLVTDGPGLPVLSHPALLGTYTLSKEQGIAHAVVFGTLARLAGADITIFTHFGGRFSTTKQDCEALIAAAARPVDGMKPILPMPGGGMTVSRVPEIVDFYGNDVILLISGDLFRTEQSLEEAARHFCNAVRDIK